MATRSYITLQDCLRGMAGSPTHVFGDDDIRIVQLSAAMLDSADKRRLKLLEAAGDNALSMAVATKCLAERLSAQTYQDARSVVTSNRKLAKLFVELDLQRFVSFVSGVSPEGKPGADAFESFVGLIYFELGMQGVIAFCHATGFYNGYTGW